MCSTKRHEWTPDWGTDCSLQGGNTNSCRNGPGETLYNKWICVHFLRRVCILLRRLLYLLRREETPPTVPVKSGKTQSISPNTRKYMSFVAEYIQASIVSVDFEKKRRKKPTRIYRRAYGHIRCPWISDNVAFFVENLLGLMLHMVHMYCQWNHMT